jgi:hypothetical protein
MSFIINGLVLEIETFIFLSHIPFKKDNKSLLFRLFVVIGFELSCHMNCVKTYILEKFVNEKMTFFIETDKSWVDMKLTIEFNESRLFHNFFLQWSPMMVLENVLLSFISAVWGSQ